MIIFNALAWGFEHVPFDASLIAALAEAFPDRPIAFHGERDHVAQTRSYLASVCPGVQATWRELELPPRLAPPGSRLLADLRLCRAMLAEARAHHAKLLIACYTHALTGLPAMKLVSRATRGCVVGYVHHGSIQKLVSSRRYHPLLAWGNGQLRQLVLGASIRAEIETALPRINGVIHAIRHPYFFEQATPSELPAGPMRFSFLGLVDDMKGFDDFVDLARAIAPEWGDRVRFDLIGGTRVDAMPRGHAPWVTTYTQAGPLARAVFNARLRETTYALFPFKPWFYRMIASGSVLDAFSAGKPIIALRNSYFEEMFETMGDIGYLCDNLEAMKATVSSLLANPPHDRYQAQSRNILAARSLYETTAVAEQLRHALS